MRKRRIDSATVLTATSPGVPTILGWFRKWAYARNIARRHVRLGIPADYARSRKLPLQRDDVDLVDVGPDIYDRPQRLAPGAAHAWREMREAAAGEGVELQLVSGFRSADYQEGIIRKKLERGQSMEQILAVSAAPGYSEHHSGRALDLTTPGCQVLEEDFEKSEAFAWLQQEGRRFGFSLSYPRGNPHGVAYEPWHWAWSGQ